MVGNTLKTCRLCKESKPFSKFYIHKDTKDRLRRECKVCFNGLSSMYYLRNKEDRSNKSKIYYYKHKYNFSEEQLRQFRNQTQCPVCMQFKTLVVDHNHRTGKIRGFICNQCNQGLGSFYDNPASLERAILYLKDDV